MKLYQVIFKVPDNFEPDKLELSASSDFDVEVCSEGFISSSCFAECEESASSDASTPSDETIENNDSVN